MGPGVRADRAIDPAEVSSRERYQILTSLVVPRPIGWIATWDADGSPNLAPFSYFAALSHQPLQVGIAVGHRRSGPKDTLLNVRSRRAFTANVVTADLLDAMNATSADVPSDVDEFELAGLSAVGSEVVDAPFIAQCPAVLECELRQEVALGEARATLIIGEIVGLRLDSALPFEEGTMSVDPRALRPVGRLAGAEYAMPGEVRSVQRPR